MEEKIDHTFKILLIGDAGVGKSSILLQFSDGYFNDNLQSTIGADFKVKVVDAAGSDGRQKRVKITVWDTAGQERFRTLTSAYYRGAQGVILVYDITRPVTFHSLNMWLQEVEQYSVGGGKEIVKLLVGNKVDATRVVTRDIAEEWANSHGMLFLESSAKTKEGIAQVFQEVVQKILENPKLLAMSVNPQAQKLDKKTSKKSSSCC